jgi:hypothetical protein
MNTGEREAIVLGDDEGGQLHATWSQSGSRLLVTVDRRGGHAQVELRPEQVRELGAFCAATTATR